MIDHTARRSLSQDLRRLITGRMTNDAFDDVYYETYGDSHDRVVREIANFAYSLYSSDLPWPYHLRDRYAVDKPTRSAAARCVLFLRSGLAYEWPSGDFVPWLQSISLYIGIPVGVAFSFLWFQIAHHGWNSFDGSCALFGTLLLAVSIIGLVSRSPLTEGQHRFYQAGEFEVWPFLRRTDFEAAQKTAYLLGRMQ